MIYYRKEKKIWDAARKERRYDKSRGVVSRVGRIVFGKCI